MNDRLTARLARAESRLAICLESLLVIATDPAAPACLIANETIKKVQEPHPSPWEGTDRRGPPRSCGE